MDSRPTARPPAIAAAHDPGGRREVSRIRLRLVGMPTGSFVPNDAGDPWTKADSRLREWAGRSPRAGGLYDLVVAELRFPGLHYTTGYRLRRHDERMLGPLLARHVRREAEFYAGRRRGDWTPDEYNDHLRRLGREVVDLFARFLDRYVIGLAGESGEAQLSIFEVVG